MNNRVVRYITRFMIDGVIAGMGLVFAYLAHYDGAIPAPQKIQLLLWIAPIVVGRLLSQGLFGIQRHKWSYVTFGDTLRIVECYGSLSAVLIIGRFLLPLSSPYRALWLPYGVIATEFLFTLSGTLAVRASWKFLERRKSGDRTGDFYRKVLLVGAGIHAVAVADEISHHGRVRVVGFVDDDPHKIGSVIGGIPVIGPISSLRKLIDKYDVHEVLICLTPAEQKKLQLDLGKDRLVRTRIVPTIDEILSADAGVLSFARPLATTPKSRLAGKPSLISDYPRSSIRDKTIIITGGAGFIGSNLARKLAANNRLVLLDITFRHKPIEFTELLGHPNIRIVEGSLLNGIDLRGLCADADIVVHTAALVGVNRVCNAERDTLETNYVGTSRLLQALEGSAKLKRFVYFSTSEIFGVNSFRVDETSPSSIGPIAESRWSYAIAKLAGEHLIKAYFRETGMPVVIVRPFNIFGPMRTGDHAILRFILGALRGNAIQVHGDGSQIRSWCYIEDFCAALLLMLESYEAVGEDFNIGNASNTLTIHELARKIVDLCGMDVPIDFVEHPFPDISIRVPSTAKAQSVLAYRPRYDLDSALALTVDWYRENLDFFTSDAMVTVDSNENRLHRVVPERGGEEFRAAANYGAS